MRTVLWVGHVWLYLYYILHTFMHRQSDNHTIAPVPVKQPWRIWIIVYKCTYCGSVRAHGIITTKWTITIYVITYHFQSFNSNNFTNQYKLPASVLFSHPGQVWHFCPSKWFLIQIDWRYEELEACLVNSLEIFLRHQRCWHHYHL